MDLNQTPGFDEDDDFGDFGGFEAAEPETSEISPTMLTPPVWANVLGTPPVGLTGSETSKRGTEISKDKHEEVQTVTRSSGHDPQLKFLNDFISSSTDTKVAAAPFPELSSNLVEKTSTFRADFLETNTDNKGSVSVNESITTNKDKAPFEVNWSKSNTSTKRSSGESKAPLKSTKTVDESKVKQLQEEVKAKSNEVQSKSDLLEMKTNQLEKLSEQKEEITLKLTDTEAQKLELDKNIEILKLDNQKLQEEMEDVKIQLKEQQGNYKQLQKEHEAELEDVKRAGNEAVTFVVDEYKELCKTSLLEQREMLLTQLTERLQKQNDQCEKILSAHQESFDSLLQTQKEQFDNSLLEKENKQTLQLKECQGESQKHASELLEEKQKEFDQVSNTQKELYQKMLREEKDGMREELTKERKEMDAYSKKLLTKCLEEERTSLKEKISEITEQVKSEAQQYIVHLKQVDGDIQRSCLASMEVLLNSTQKQLQVIVSQQKLPKTTPDLPNTPSGSSRDGNSLITIDN